MAVCIGQQQGKVLASANDLSIPFILETACLLATFIRRRHAIPMILGIKCGDTLVTSNLPCW
ncbi:MAG: hypothetical protein ACI88A_002312 [Paraglaciecola sp.]|jgi:hypothetical protein